MSKTSFSDGSVPRSEPSLSGHQAPVPDAHGQAALLLVESLIHGLVARGALTVAEAVEIVDIASDAKEEMAHEIGEPEEQLLKSLALLEAIERTLLHDYQPPT